jgi:serine protease AprX
MSLAMNTAKEINVAGFKVDETFTPVPSTPPSDMAGSLAAANEQFVTVRGEIPEGKIKELESQPNVVKVWRDTPIAPFSCPIPPCDCSFGDPAIGDIGAVAGYLGVNNIWSSGIRGSGIVIGIVDGGITAIGRTPRPGETARISRVIGGWPTADWGTTAAAWTDHGNMTATDALGMAPEAQIYDIRISDGNAISNALQGFQWAINQHRTDGTPHILSNSWGIFQEAWDPAYARDPNHPFTRKVVEAINEGIIVLFAAGNCGGTCPDGRCGPDTGPGRSIWGANGHPRVITVGAVNLNERFVGYSSQGPAALDPNKPDVCSITHFAGYFPNVNPAFPSDGGTSAATPIAAGVVALLKQAKSALTQDEAKDALKRVAKDIGPGGWDQHAGQGIIHAKGAYDSILPKLKFRDDVKLKFRDDVKLKFRDDGKLKFRDDVKTPGHDNIGRYTQQSSATGSSPFILSTPHHSMEWAAATPTQSAQPEAQQYEAALSEYEAVLAQLEHDINERDQELSALHEMYLKTLDDYTNTSQEYHQQLGQKRSAQ